MPTAKNGFQILNLHPKKHVFKKKYPFFMYFCLSNTKFLKLFSPQYFPVMPLCKFTLD